MKIKLCVSGMAQGRGSTMKHGNDSSKNTQVINGLEFFLYHNFFYTEYCV